MISQFLLECTLGKKWQKIKLKKKYNSTSSADTSEWMSDFQSDVLKELLVVKVT